GDGAAVRIIWIPWGWWAGRRSGSCRCGVSGTAAYDTRGRSSGPRVRLPVRLPEAIRADVGVALRGGEGRVPQQLLDRPQVCAALEQVGGSRVSESVRTDVRRTGHLFHPPVNHLPHHPRVDASSTGTQEEGWPGAGGGQLRTTGAQPPLHSLAGGEPVRHAALLAPLAEDPDDAAVPVDVVDVEADQLPHP